METSATTVEALALMPVIDGHNDLATALRAASGYAVEGLDTGLPELHTDLPRLRAGGVGAQFWSVYVPSDLPSEAEAVVATMEQVDAVQRMVARYPDDLALTYTAADVERVIGTGRIASLLGIEGGHCIAESLGVLRSFARLGVRYMTLTHNDNTSWADSATDTPAVGGLNDTGRAIVAEMNRIGMLVDLSHVAPPTMHAALDVATAPVIFSHSSARARCDHVRNAPDDVLTRLAGNGGALQVTFVPSFVSPAVAAWEAASMVERARLGLKVHDWAWPRAPRPGENAADALAANAAAAAKPDARYDDWLGQHPRPVATIADVADHVDHAREVAGIAHVGIGGDYDGADGFPVGLADVAGYPRLLDELVARGWSASDLAALTGRNVLRVMRDAEQAATEPLWPTSSLR